MKSIMKILSCCLILFVTLSTAGCGGTFIQNEARSSLASFLGSVATNAITNTIDP